MVEKGLASASSPPVLAHRVNKKKDFAGYVRVALKKFGLSENAISDDEARAYYDVYKKNRVHQQVIVLWTLRALLAPVLESIVLVDRWIYLKQVIREKGEENAGVWMWPLFDPQESPRNVVFVATKF